MTGGIGAAIERLDGPDKVTGRALYAADTPWPDTLHAVIVPATLPKGRIERIDTAAALAAPGVVSVLTFQNSPKLNPMTVVMAEDCVLPLQDDRVSYEGQPLALVVAESLEEAEAAARLVRIACRPEAFDADFRADPERSELVESFFGVPLQARRGDPEAALAAADTAVSSTYLTADRHHNPIEPVATLARWQDGRLEIVDSTQGVTELRDSLAQAFGLAPEQIRVKAPFLGGGFGAKGWGLPHQLLAAIATRALERPVKLVLTRAQSYTAHGYQTATQQSLSLSALSDGTLTGLTHHSIVAGAVRGEHVEAVGWDTPAIYATENFAMSHRLRRLDRGNPAAMRSPFGGVGLVPVESAIDELAHALALDPLALRLKNYAETDPQEGLPFSAKNLRACYEEGARRFGWATRPLAPRSLREGRDLVGWGMATAILRAFRFPASAEVAIDRDGRVTVSSGAHDVGQGLSTILPQIAAEVLGLPVARVGLAIGDSALPTASFTGGSSTTMSVGTAVRAAAEALKQRLAEAGANGPEGYAGALAALGVERLSAEGSWTPDEAPPTASIYSFGAVFAEVRVDIDIPVPRVSRVVGVYDAGRILNPRTARSQMTGGIIWGIGQALLERSETDPRLGRFLSKNLSGYLLPSQADVGDIEVAFVEGHDPHVGPLGGRGIGELGAIGIGGAILNAVFHATGKRVREIPVRPEHLL